MAIRVLLDHGVPASHIIFVTFLVSRAGGISSLRSAFPEVIIVTGAVDDGLREAWLEGMSSDSHGQRSAGRNYDAEGIDGQGGRRVFAIEPGMGQIGQSQFIGKLVGAIHVYADFFHVSQVTVTTYEVG